MDVTIYPYPNLSYFMFASGASIMHGASQLCQYQSTLVAPNVPYVSHTICWLGMHAPTPFSPSVEFYPLTSLPDFGQIHVYTLLNFWFNMNFSKEYNYIDDYLNLGQM